VHQFNIQTRAKHGKHIPVKKKWNIEQEKREG